MSQLLYDSWDPVTRRSVWIETDAETGLPLLTWSQDTKPIIEANKRAASNFQGANPDGFTKVASIPLVVVENLKKEGTWWDQAAMKRWLDDPANRFFRTDDGRKL